MELTRFVILILIGHLQPYYYSFFFYYDANKVSKPMGNFVLGSVITVK
jgi:hypothetical protein